MLTYVWIALSYFGDIAYWLGFTISFFFIYPWLYERDKKRAAWIYKQLLPAVLLSYALVFGLKLYFKVPRPCVGMPYCPHTYSFPSGHSTIVFVFATTILLVYRKKKYWIPAYILALLVAYARLGLNVHTVSDVIAGALLGSIITLVWFLFYNKVSRSKIDHFVIRKIIHLSALAVIPVYPLLPRTWMTAGGLAGLVIFGISEYFRMKKIYFPYVQDITNYCLKKQERDSFALSPWLFGLALLFLIQLPFKNFLAGTIALVLGDGLAGLIGYSFGNKDKKSLVGSLTFFLSVFVSLLFVFSWMKALCLAFAGMMLERYAKEEENLLVGLAVGFLSFL